MFCGIFYIRAVKKRSEIVARQAPLAPPGGDKRVDGKPLWRTFGWDYFMDVEYGHVGSCGEKPALEGNKTFFWV